MTPEEKEELQRLIKIKRRLQELKEEQLESKVELKDVHKKVLVQSFSSIRNLVELKKIIGSWSHELV